MLHCCVPVSGLPSFDAGAMLAPMAGYSDAPFRWLCRRYGSVWSVTEMVSAKGLRLDPTRGIEIGAPYRGEPNLSVQLFASDPDDAAYAVDLLDRRYGPAGFDLNMGCPVKKIAHKGCGVQLMRSPARAATIVAAMRAGTDRPVSVKMRLGYDEVVVDDVAAAVVQAGASWITVHGRTGLQKYGGEADWSHAERLASIVDVPVVGSGDVIDLASFQARSGRGTGIMIGRGALGRPWVFSTVRDGREPRWAEAAEIMLEHARLHASWYGAHGGVRSLRGHLAKYVASFPEAAALRADLVRADTVDDVVRIVVPTLPKDARDRATDGAWPLGGPHAVTMAGSLPVTQPTMHVGHA